MAGWQDGRMAGCSLDEGPIAAMPGKILPDLLDPVSDDLTQLSGNGGDDPWKCHEAIPVRGSRADIPPRHNARIKQHDNAIPPLPRDKILRHFRQGGAGWVEKGESRQIMCNIRKRLTAAILRHLFWTVVFFYSFLTPSFGWTENGTETRIATTQPSQVTRENAYEAMTKAIDDDDLDAMQRLAKDFPGILPALDEAGEHSLLDLDLERKRGEYSKIALFLIDKNVHLERKNSHGRVPLHSAVQNGNLSAVKRLLEKKVSVDPSAESITPLDLAAVAGRLDLIEMLVAYGAKPLRVLDPPFVAGTDEFHHSFEYAVVGGRLPVIKYLVQRGADLKWQGYGKPLLVRVMEGMKWKDNLTRQEAARFLVEHGVDLPEGEWNGKHAVHYLAAIGSPSLLEKSLSHKGNLDLRDDNGMTPLHLSVEADRADLVDLLLRHGAAPDVTDKAGFTPLMIAARDGFVDIIDVLLKHGANPYLASSKAECRSPLVCSIQHEHQDAAIRLLNGGTDTRIQGSDAGFPLHEVAQHGLTSLVALLVSRGVPVDSLKKNKTPLFLALNYGHLETARALLAVGANINGGDGDHTLLAAMERYYAFREQSKDADSSVNFLLAHPGLASPHDPEMADRLLVRASLYGSESVFSWLLEHGAQWNRTLIWNKKNPKGQTTVLYHIARSNRIELLKILLERRGDIRIAADSDGDTILHVAAGYGNTSIMELALANGVPINQINNMGKTALHVACTKNQEAAILFLLRHGADKNALDQEGNAPAKYLEPDLALRLMVAGTI